VIRKKGGVIVFGGVSTPYVDINYLLKHAREMDLFLFNAIHSS